MHDRLQVPTAGRYTAGVMPAADKRQHERVTVDAFVRVEGGERAYVFRTRDISQGGLFLYTRVGHIYPFKVGNVVSIELYDYDRFARAKAVVVRVVRDATPEAERFPLGFGLRFIEVAADDRKVLDDMIERAKHGEDPY
jgi:c-di-GMP-binding flagellar brake protein YcgR